MSASPAGVLALLKGLRGKGCISGQFTELKGVSQTATGGAIAQIAAVASKPPGLIGGDYWYYGSTAAAADLTFNPLAIAYAQAGGLVTLTLSIPNPTTQGASSDVSALDAGGLLTPGTPTNANLLRSLDSIAAGLAALQAAGVPVLLRPFHEFNGSWFWWGSAHLTPAQFNALWRFIRNYLVRVKGLSNLLWVWAANAGLAQFPAMPRYPGDPFVDVTGLDLYTSSPASAAGDIAALVALKKPVMLSEFGSGSPSGADPAFQEATLVAALKGMPDIVAWQQWWAPWGIESTPDAKTAMADPYVLNRGDFAVAPPVTPAALLAQVQQAAALLEEVRTGLGLLTT